MYETVSVDEALSKARRTVTTPTVIVVVAVIIGFALLAMSKTLPPWMMLVGVGIGAIAGWICWSILITRWRLWAFENVRNVHELKKRAIKERLIGSDGSFFEKTEIRNAADKDKWNSLQDKFLKEDVFIDDMAIPEETNIYYSKGKNFLEMAVMLIIFGVGFFIIVYRENYIIGAILTLIGAYLSYREFLQATNKNPQIVISNKGIKLASAPFYSWQEIANEDVLRQSTGKATLYYLVYDHPGGSVKKQIDDYAITHKELERLLRLYRGRSSQTVRG